MDLPKLTLVLHETNPDWEPLCRAGESRPYNMDEYQDYYEIEVEVVVLNLNSGTMRVRYEWPDKRDKNVKSGVTVRSRDVSIEHFFALYEINELSVD